MISIKLLCQQDSSDSDVPLDGAQARLEILKDNLLKREREISVLMEGQNHVTEPVEQSAYAHLLSAVIQQVISFSEMYWIFNLWLK